MELVQLLEEGPPLLHVAQGQADDIGVGEAGLSGFHGQGKPTLSVITDSRLSALLVRRPSA